MNRNTEITLQTLAEQEEVNIGYIDNEILANQRLSTPRTAAEAQMRVSGAPILDFPEESEDNEASSSSSAGALRQ